MACEASIQIGTPPAIPNPNNGMEAYVANCVAWDNWVNTEYVPKSNAMYICINGWYASTLSLRDETEVFRNETLGYRNETEAYKNETLGYRNETQTLRDETQEIADGVTANLPEGTISDNTVATDTTWSSDKLMSLTKAQSATLIYDAENALIRVEYADGAKEILNYIDGRLGYVVYTETDGTTEKFRETLNYDANGVLVSITRS